MSFFFPGRLAWRQLVFDRTKLIAAISGVLFATVLVFMQIGFRDSLYASAASAPTRMDGDLFLVHKQSEAMWRPIHFTRTELMRTLAHSQVAEVQPLYMGLAPFKNPSTQSKRTLMVYGYDPKANIFNAPEIISQQQLLTIKDNVIFDESSRPEFGPIRQLHSEGKDTTEINDYKVKIVGFFRLGASFAADGNIVTSDLNFLRIFPSRTADEIDMGVIRLAPGADINAVQTALKTRLNENINVFTYKELVDFEQGYWKNRTPIGFIFGFGTIMGLVVGMVIVYQILFTDITNHLNEFATLKAMGYSHGYFVKVVFASAFFLAVLGFVPGFGLAYCLYKVAESATFLPMPMSEAKVITVFLFILSMCAAAGLLAMRKLKAANPADMF